MKNKTTNNPWLVTGLLFAWVLFLNMTLAGVAWACWNGILAPNFGLRQLAYSTTFMIVSLAYLGTTIIVNLGKPLPPANLPKS